MSQNTSSAPTCQTCRWWGGRLSGRVYTPGPCHRYPPTAIVRDNRYEVVQSAWPVTRIDDWCGEHQPQEAQR